MHEVPLSPDPQYAVSGSEADKRLQTRVVEEVSLTAHLETGYSVRIIRYVLRTSQIRRTTGVPRSQGVGVFV